MMTMREVASWEFYFDLDEKEYALFDGMMAKFNDYSDCSNETLIEELTNEEHKFIIDKLMLDAAKDFYNSHKGYFIYLFAKKLITYIFEYGYDEEYVYYLEGLVKVVKNYHC